MAKKKKTPPAPTYHDDIVQFALLFQDKLMEHGVITAPISINWAVGGFVRDGSSERPRGPWIHLSRSPRGSQGSSWYGCACGTEITTEKNCKTWHQWEQVTCPRCREATKFPEAQKWAEEHRAQLARQEALRQARIAQVAEQLGDVDPKKLAELLVEKGLADKAVS
jgi:hypothetical protein